MNVISSCLVTMRDAQSPNLRRKVAALAQTSTILPENANYILQSLEIGVWKAVLSNVKLPSLLPRRSVLENTGSPLSSTTRDTERLPLATDLDDEMDDTIYEGDVTSTVTFGEDFFSSGSQISAPEPLEGDIKTPPDYSSCDNSITFYEAIGDLENEEQIKSPLDIIRFYEDEEPNYGAVPTQLGQISDQWRGNGTISFSEEIKMI